METEAFLVFTNFKKAVGYSPLALMDSEMENILLAIKEDAGYGYQ